MAGDAGFGMERGALKALLVRSKKEPVSCALGKGKEANAAYILLDKIKNPKALQAALEKEFPDIKDPRRGTASVDTDVDPKLVVFSINRPASGLAPRMIKLLKPVGFSKVRFVFEDGSAEEALSGEEEEEGSGAEGDEGVSAAPPSPPQPPPAAINSNELRDRLTALVERMREVIKNDPSRTGALMALAKQAQFALGTNNLKAATQSTDALEAELDAAAASPAPAPQPTAKPSAASGPVAYAKSRLAWLAVRKKMETDLETLRKQILDFYKNEDIVGELGARYTERVKPILSNLDESSLADALDMATNATDPDERSKLVAQSQEIIKRYQSFLTSEPFFKELDTNPFVPLAITKTMDTTLATLAAAIR